MLTPKMRDVVERMARARHPALHRLTPAEAKAAYEKGAGVLEVPKPELARIEDLAIVTRDGQTVPARLYAPAHDRLPVLVYFHGGGFTVGSIATHDTLCRVLAARSVGAPLHAAAYPNPLAADSRLTYTVADQTQPVTVEALNSLGQRAALLLDAAPQAPGEHSLALAPLQRLAPGVYLVRVQAGSQLTSQRVVVN